MAAEIITDNEAWKRAWRTRCCPPDHVMAEPSAELTRHCAICPWCREELMDGLEKLFVKVTIESPAPAVVSSGDICAVRTELSGWWEKGRYYNAPLILVLDLIDGDRVSVLQVYDDLFFADVDDIMLGPQISGFAEPWNRYTLDIGDLAYTLATVSVDVLDAARTARKKDNLEIEEGSLLWFFRNMEVESGFFFALKAVPHQGEKPLSPLLPPENESQSEPSLTQWYQELHRLNLLPASIPSKIALTELLARTTLSDEFLPLAARDSQPTLTALAFSWNDQKLSCYPLNCAITAQEIKDTIMMISGLVIGPAEKMSQFICWWQEGTNLLPPLPGRFGYDEGSFWATFELGEESRLTDGRLLLRFIQKE